MTAHAAAQDPNELFDVVTSDGEPTGVAKSRADVHRDGDWHRSIHVWVAGIDRDGPFLTFQRRSMAKDTSPGRFDATVGGHFRAGESLLDTLREVEEEIGIAVGLDDLRFAGRRICLHEFEPGILDRELQEIYFLRDDRELTGFAPNPAELAALVKVRVPDLLEFLAEERDELPARSIAAGSAIEEAISITRSDLTMRADRYLYRVAIAVERFLAGERHIAV